MLLLADPIGVFNEYTHQARDLGYEMRGGCQVSDEERNAMPLAEYKGDNPQLVTCNAEYYRTSAREPIDLLRVAIELYFGEVAGFPASTVNVSFVKAGDGSGDPSRYQIGPPLVEVRDPIPSLPAFQVPDLPTIGKPIATQLSQRATRLVVPPQSRLAALPAPGARCTTGWDAILLTTDLAAVLKNLEAQVASIAEEPIIRTQERRGDVMYTFFTVDPAGDDRVEIVGVDGEGDDAVLVSAC